MNEEQTIEKDKTVAEDYLSDISQKIYGNWVSQVTCVFAELGVADALISGPKNLEDLATGVKAQKDYLKRFLRCAAELELVTYDDLLHVYAVTGLGAILSSGHPQSKREEARLNGSAYRYQPWGHLAEVIRTGLHESYSPTLKSGSLDFLQDKPEQRTTFHKAMTERSRVENEAVLRNFSFGNFTRVLDIGSGEGSFIRTILDKNPHLTGFMFDLKETFEKPIEPEYQNRLTQLYGDFFVEIPAVADAYTMKSVIHNWPENKAIKILESVRKAMASTDKISTEISKKRLFIVENLLPETTGKSIANWMDLNFMITIDGAERTKEEYRILGEKAGLNLCGVTPTSSGRHLIEFSL